MTLYIGTAGWTIPRDEKHRFAEEGSHLERYSSRFNAVEINSTFHRPHRASTFSRWAATVPADFRFSAKVPKTITHEFRLRHAEPLLESFLNEVTNLGERLGCLLVQLPPSAAFDPDIVLEFLEEMRSRWAGGLVFEPRHASWFEAEAENMLEEFRVARVAADPARAPGGNNPGAHRDLVYYRLHGFPRVYYSSYSDEFLDDLAARLHDEHRAGREVWCLFDNTALGAATANALGVLARLRAGG